MTDGVLLEHILPSNATKYERTLANQLNRLLALDTERLHHLWDPYKCHIDDLPFLAWAFSVDVWDSDWDEEKKRNIVANSIAMHKLKTTQAGIDTYLTSVGSILRKVVAPPAKGYRIPAFSNDEFLQWLSQLPQIRVYPFQINQDATSYDFRMPIFCFRGDGFRPQSLGPQLYGQRATLYQDGEETPITLNALGGIGAEAIYQVAFANYLNVDFHSDGFRGDSFREDTTAAANVVTVSFDQNASQYTSITPGLKPQTVLPVREAEIHTAPNAQGFHGYTSDFRDNGFRLKTDAPLWIWDRVALYKEESVPTPLKTKWYRGHMRYGIKPFNAELTVEIPMTWPYARGFGTNFRNGFRVSSDMTPLWTSCDAIVSSKALKDTVLVDTQVYRKIRLGDSRPLGSYKLGEIIRVA